MTEFAAIRAALKANIDPVNDGGEDWIEVNAYAFPEPGFRIPIIMVWGIDDEEGVTFGRGSTALHVVIRAVTGTMTEVPPQVDLDKLMMGDLNLVDLLESDKTLGGLADDLFVTGMSGHREFIQGSSRLLGCEWRVLIVLST